jgi:hypothetical protein
MQLVQIVLAGAAIYPVLTGSEPTTFCRNCAAVSMDNMYVFLFKKPKIFWFLDWNLAGLRS